MQVLIPKKWEGRWGRNNPAAGHKVEIGSGGSTGRAPQSAGLQQQYLSHGKREKSRERQRRRRNVRETRLSCAFREQALVYILLCFPGRRPRALRIFGACAPGEGEQELVAAAAAGGAGAKRSPPRVPATQLLNGAGCLELLARPCLTWWPQRQVEQSSPSHETPCTTPASPSAHRALCGVTLGADGCRDPFRGSRISGHCRLLPCSAFFY